MLQQGYCYACLFALKYSRQIIASLGQIPTFSRVEEELRIHPISCRGDLFITAYTFWPFMAYIAKFQKENPIYMGTLHRLNDGLPICVGTD